MASRMDRYKNENYENEIKRSSKNQELYQNIGTNAKYTNFTDVRKSNTYMIDNRDVNNYTRENYQHMKEYTNITPKTRVRKEFDDFNNLYNTNQNKVYDINSVLEKAKEQRVNRDEESQRKLKNTNYNILASLNPKELEKYREEKKKRLKADDDGIKELIDTMISKTLAGEISKETGVDLLSDLMATSALDRIPGETEKIIKEEKKIEQQKEIKKDEPKENKQEVLDKTAIKKIQKEKYTVQTENDIMKDIDQSFYTKSMDLSDKDFFTGDEEVERKIPLPIKIILFIVIVGLITTGIYFLYQSF